ncbi:hypothetical protein EDB81DRAFT_829724 [Dactylonectria macrodidyma]|uniref:Uncharacterized protein n=1 Tax=Dactylonectria macrodidyma TaxID=307937 RepID=A0A9P9I9M7_9HYPO|nr:hypothetical protein EDB81DRAFT_829724 [Dactylonectria macrodidyma]
MATPKFQFDSTKNRIEGGAACALEDSSIGTQVVRFQDSGFVSFSDEGVKLFTDNSLKREDITKVVKGLVTDDPTWATVQGLGPKIPPGYAYRFYPGSPERRGVMVYLCSPQIHVAFYHGSQTLKTKVDEAMSRRWGVLITPEKIMDQDGISKDKGRTHYIHSTLGPSRVDVRFLGNYIVDVAHIRPEWNGCTHVDL